MISNLRQPNEPDLTRPELAKKMNVSLTTVDKWVVLGVPCFITNPGTKKPRRRFFHSDVVRFLSKFN